MTRPSWLRRVVTNRHHHAIEQASRRWREGGRDDSARTRVKSSTQVDKQASKSKADRAKELKRLQNMKTGGTRPELAAWVNKRKKILAKMEL